METKLYDHRGVHATADILLNSYPQNAILLFEESLKYCKLNVVDKKIKQFTPEAATGVYVLAESSADIHEYPEVDGGYICVSVFTCGQEGDPIAAIKHFISLLDVKDANIKCFNRGHFEEEKISMAERAFWNTDIDEVHQMQHKMDNISKSLSAEQIKDLKAIIDWCSSEKVCDHDYSNSQFE